MDKGSHRKFSKDSTLAKMGKICLFLTKCTQYPICLVIWSHAFKSWGSILLIRVHMKYCHNKARRYRECKMVGCQHNWEPQSEDVEANIVNPQLYILEQVGKQTISQIPTFEGL